MNRKIHSILKRINKNYYIYRFYYLLRYAIPYSLLGEERYNIREMSKKWKKSDISYKLNIEDPKTLNEKIQWLKLNEKKDFHTVCADKLTSRKYWVEKTGIEDYLVPLLYQTYDWKDITADILPDEPFVIKCSSGSDCYKIVHDKKNVDIRSLRNDCRRWLSMDYYLISQEWQYKNAKPAIIIEKLLLDENGKIPNDYKFHCMNGELVFVYCAVDREGANYRSVYSPNWEMMDIEWVSSNSHKGAIGAKIPKPHNYDEMVRIALTIAKDFKYVRVDFYEVENRLYYGEITLHHGSGYDVFVPEEWDAKLGERLDLE